MADLGAQPRAVFFRESPVASGGAILSRGAAYCGLPPGGGTGLYEAAVCGERGLSQSRCLASPVYAVPLGTPTGEMNSLKGVGDGPNFLRAGFVAGWQTEIRVPEPARAKPSLLR